MTIATGPVKHRYKRKKCYRASSSVSHYELKINNKHSHEMEAGWELKELCSRWQKDLADESM